MRENLTLKQELLQQILRQEKDLVAKWDEDAKALRAAEAMRKIYHTLLIKMRSDKFHVFSQRYSLSKAKKTSILISSLLGK